MLSQQVLCLSQELILPTHQALFLTSIPVSSLFFFLFRFYPPPFVVTSEVLVTHTDGFPSYPFLQILRLTQFRDLLCKSILSYFSKIVF